MLKTKLLLAAESVLVDKGTNNISALNIFNDKVAETFPVTIPKIVLLFLLEKDSADEESQNIKVEVRINNEVLTIIDNAEIKFVENNSRTVVNLGNLNIVAPGKIQFNIIVNDAVLSSYNFDISSRK